MTTCKGSRGGTDGYVYSYAILNKAWSMFGDYLRDLSVLILVFVPLELSKGNVISVTLLLSVIAVSVVLLFAGIYCEKAGKEG